MDEPNSHANTCGDTLAQSIDVEDADEQQMASHERPVIGEKF
jgi:hypothetical protein